jgi:hypothetical protein
MRVSPTEESDEDYDDDELQEVATTCWKCQILKKCKKLRPHPSAPDVRSCEILGSHCSEYEDGCLLGCCAMYSGRSLVMFQRCFLLITLMMEAASTSETSVNFYQTLQYFHILM